MWWLESKPLKANMTGAVGQYIHRLLHGLGSMSTARKTGLKFTSPTERQEETACVEEKPQGGGGVRLDQLARVKICQPGLS